MKKLRALVVLISLGIGSCSSPPPPTTVVGETPSSPSPSVSPTTVAAVPSPVTETPSRPTVAIPGLVPSVNADQRRKEVNKGRQDPFAVFPVQGTVKVKPRKDIVKINIRKPQSSNTALKQKNNPNKDTSGRKTANNQTRVKQLVPLTPPDLANATVVTGVMAVGDTIKVVVKAPNENTSRYVQEGQYISNGRVLVKRIENPNSYNPIVVLEERGQEVYKKVGQEMIAQPKTAPKSGVTMFNEG